jgi:hypothetical protein
MVMHRTFIPASPDALSRGDMAKPLGRGLFAFDRNWGGGGGGFQKFIKPMYSEKFKLKIYGIKT